MQDQGKEETHVSLLLMYKHASSLERPSSVKHTNIVTKPFSEFVETILVAPRQKHYWESSNSEVAVFDSRDELLMWHAVSTPREARVLDLVPAF